MFNLIEETRGTLYGPNWDILALGLADLLDDGVLSLNPAPPPTDFSFAAFCEDFSLPVRNHTEFPSLLAESRQMSHTAWEGEAVIARVLAKLPVCARIQGCRRHRW